MKTSMNLTLIALTWLLAGSVSAQDLVRGSDNDDETIYVGMVDIAGVAGGQVAAVCFDSDNDVNDRIVALGTTSGLDDDKVIHGDSADSGTGADTMIVIAIDNSDPGGPCGGSLVVGTWDRLVYNGFYLDLDGDGGNEAEIDDGGGSNNTFIRGAGGADYLEQHSAIGSARGGAGNDTLYGLTGGNDDSLRGEADSDCLWDGDNSFLTFDCGTGTDTRNNGNTGTTSCEISSPSCGLI